MELGKIVGGGLIVGATAAIWFWPESEKAQTEPEPVRPIRSEVVAASDRMPDLKFVGTVKATESRTLAFKQAGRIERIPVSKGQKLKKGDKLAWLDPQDFRNRLTLAEAAVQRDRLSFQRKSEAAKKRAISSEELSQAESQLKQSEATYELAKRALEETVLVAPFDCVVADIPATELDMTSANGPAVVIQDLSKIKIDVIFPETVIIMARKLQPKANGDYLPVVVTFESCPGRKFDAKFLEYTSTADAKTQTYVGTYIMDPPKDLLLLQGMTATVTFKGETYRLDEADRETDRKTVPESAVAVDTDGGNFVWKMVETAEKGVFEVRKTKVKVGHNVGDRVFVTDGVVVGDRVATAGVSILTEGRKVRLQGK